MGQIDVEYYIDGKNFKDYGVYVSESSGITSKLEIKDLLKTDYPDCNGYSIDPVNIRYKERNITLKCFIESKGWNDYIPKFNSFMDLFNGGYHRFKIEVGVYILVYEIYVQSSIDPQKTWDPNYMVGTFDIKMIEPNPVKRILQFTGSGSATITLTSLHVLDIHWGDNSHDFDVSGTNITVSHAYTSGTHEIIIAGMIDNITDFSTNCIVLWNKLQ